MIERFRNVIAEARRRLKAADAELVSASAIGGINTALSSLENLLSQFIVDGAPGHLEKAISNADAAVAQFPQLLFSSTSADVEAFAEAATSFRRSAGQHLRYRAAEADAIRGSLEQVRSGLAELNSNFEAQKGRLDKLISQSQTQFTRAWIVPGAVVSRARPEHE